MNKLNNLRAVSGLALLVLLTCVCAGCGSRMREENLNFPPNSAYKDSQFNVNVAMRPIGLDQTQITVSIYGERRKPYFKRAYDYKVYAKESLHCEIQWDTLDDLQLLFEVRERMPGSLFPVANPGALRKMELHFAYDRAADTFREVPHSVPFSAIPNTRSRSSDTSNAAQDK